VVVATGAHISQPPDLFSGIKRSTGNRRRGSIIIAAKMWAEPDFQGGNENDGERSKRGRSGPDRWLLQQPGETECHGCEQEWQQGSQMAPDQSHMREDTCRNDDEKRDHDREEEKDEMTPFRLASQFDESRNNQHKQSDCAEG